MASKKPVMNFHRLKETLDLMFPKPQMQRAFLILFLLVCCGGSLWGLLFVFQSSLVFYYTPQDFVGKHPFPLKKIRLGGMVAYGSLRRQGPVFYFRMTDHSAALEVAYQGLLPHLFREGGDVILEGVFDSHKNLFEGHQILIKHDEVYASSSSCEISSARPRNPNATK